MISHKEKNSYASPNCSFLMIIAQRKELERNNSRVMLAVNAGMLLYLQDIILLHERVMNITHY